jgi:hypothetical protein
MAKGRSASSKSSKSEKKPPSGGANELASLNGKQATFIEGADLSPTPRNVRTRQQWAAEIAATYRGAVEAIIETGRKLIAAKDELPHGDFLEMIKNDLPFGSSKAQALMRIARHPVLSNAQSIAHLPASWAVLSDLVALDVSDETMEKMLADGTIDAQSDRGQVKELAKKFKELKEIDQDENVYWWDRLEQAFDVLIKFKNTRNTPQDIDRFAEMSYKLRFGERLAFQIGPLAKFLAEVDQAV